MAKLRDLGLSYEAAAHGVQSAVRFDMEQRNSLKPRSTSQELKHLRVGLDCRAADAQGLAALLIAKGVFTMDEYLEHMRLAMNEELARYTEHCQKEYDLPPGAQFR